MILAMAAYAAAPSLVPHRRQGWIYKPCWDLPLLIFSAILVPLPFLVAWAAEISGWMKPQQSINLINLVVAALIGGPHLFSTITYTFLDGRFRARHPWYSKLAFLLPVGVVYLGVKQYTLLITFFFTWLRSTSSTRLFTSPIATGNAAASQSGRGPASWIMA